MTYWMYVDGMYCPKVTDDWEQAKDWIESPIKSSGRVVRVDDVTEIEGVQECKPYVEVEDK